MPTITANNIMSLIIQEREMRNATSAIISEDHPFGIFRIDPHIVMIAMHAWHLREFHSAV